MYIECQGVLWGLHCVPFVSLWVALGSLWDALGRHWDALGHTLGHLGLHWGVLGMPWDHFGMSGDHFGTYWNSGVRRNPHRKPMALKYRACAQKQASWNLPTGPGGSGETVHELQFRTYLPHAPGIRMT